MPKRTNLFQDVVAIIHRHTAGDAPVEESAMLVNRVTGEEREVDVVIRSEASGYSVTVSVEATSGKRRADSPWVEKMLGKHENLPTDKLVLVAEGGFTKPARALARSARAVPIAPDDLGEADPAGEIVNQLKSLWPKLLALTPERLRLEVERPNGSRAWFRAERDHIMFLHDGTEIATLAEWVDRVLHKRFVEIAEGLGLRDIANDLDAFFELQSEGPHAVIDGNRIDTFVRFEEAQPPEFHRITAVHVVGRVHVEVREVELRHVRLGDVMVATGQTKFGNQDTVLVVTETDAGDKKLTMRFRPVRRESGPDT